MIGATADAIDKAEDRRRFDVAMKKIGDTMSSTLKETAEGGLAVTPTGKKLCEKVFG